MKAPGVAVIIDNTILQLKLNEILKLTAEVREHFIGKEGDNWRNIRPATMFVWPVNPED